MPEAPDKDRWKGTRKLFANEELDLITAPKVEVFFGNEAGIEGDPRPRQRWVKRGSRPTEPDHGGHLRQNIAGVANPRDGQLASPILPHHDTEVLQAFFDTRANEVPAAGSRIVLVLDHASWHKSRSLNWHPTETKLLPSYSPDFNPFKRL